MARKQVYEERVRRMQRRKVSRYDPSDEWDDAADAGGHAPEEPPARSGYDRGGPSRERRGSHGAERHMPRRTVSKEDVIRAKEMEREREIEKRKSQLAEAMREVRVCACVACCWLQACCLVGAGGA